MSTTAYLSIKGTKQGLIKGDVTAKGREGTIALTAVSFQIATPFDQASGAPTGKRQHQPLTITKLVDKTSPLLFQALVTNETLADVTIALWETSADGSGKEKQYYTITLTDARIVGVMFTSPNTLDPTKVTMSPSEEVRFTYQKIAWTWVEGGITAQDDWLASV